MLEATILKYLLNRANFARYYPHLKKITLEPELTKLFDLLPVFFDNSDQDTCSLAELKALFTIEYPQIKDPLTYTELFRQIEEAEIGDAICGRMVEKLIYKDAANRIVQTCMPVLSDADKGEALSDIREIIDAYDQLIMPDAEDDIFVTDDLYALIEKKINAPGLEWRLKGLNEKIGPLRGGTLGHAFARPDIGKTTFLISEMSNWARQLQQNEIGIWVNNEEDGFTLKLRWYSAITGWPLAAVLAQPERAIAYYNQLYASRVKLLDRAGLMDFELEAIVKRFRPRFMIIDQGDKIKSRTGKNTNETARLGQLYRDYREWAKKYEMDILTVGQAHADASGQKFLRDSWMNNSKTEKPGELDYAIGIGIDGIANDLDLRRFITVCKNKSGPHGSFVAMMDPHKARYTD